MRFADVINKWYDMFCTLSENKIQHAIELGHTFNIRFNTALQSIIQCLNEGGMNKWRSCHSENLHKETANNRQDTIDVGYRS